MKTRLTELLGIEHPIIQGGMHYAGYAGLAAAVSNAGGLGIITALTLPTPEELASEITLCKEMTDKPFAVNITILPTFHAPPYAEYVQAMIEGGVKIVETAGRSPKPFMPAFNAAGVKVIHKCTSVRHALTAEKIGCAAASIDGFECAGHPGEDDIPGLILLPLAAEALTIPFVASGGMANAEHLVAALALGADGINMGTRFLATVECPVHQNVKDALVAADELQTAFIFRPLRNTARVMKNTPAIKIMEIEAEKGEATSIEDIKHLVEGEQNRKVMLDGEMDAGIWSAGLNMALIHDIPTVRELVERIVYGAEDIINNRLASLVATSG